MKIRLAVTALVTAGLAAAPAPKSAPTPRTLGLGDALPEGVALHDLDGDVHDLAALRGRVVVLHLWSATCPWELVAEPKINALASDYADAGVVVLGLAANAPEIGAPPDPESFTARDPDDRPYRRLRDRAAERDIDHPILVDHGARLAGMIGGETTPHVFVFDREGRMVYTGALDDDGRGADPSRSAGYVRAAVEAALAGDEVVVAKTRPYGGRAKFGSDRTGRG